jgi:hypothetical protein
MQWWLHLLVIFMIFLVLIGVLVGELRVLSNEAAAEYR